MLNQKNCNTFKLKNFLKKVEDLNLGHLHHTSGLLTTQPQINQTILEKLYLMWEDLPGFKPTTLNSSTAHTFLSSVIIKMPLARIGVNFSTLKAFELMSGLALSCFCRYIGSWQLLAWEGERERERERERRGRGRVREGNLATIINRNDNVFGPGPKHFSSAKRNICRHFGKRVLIFRPS